MSGFIWAKPAEMVSSETLCRELFADDVRESSQFLSQLVCETNKNEMQQELNHSERMLQSG